MRWPRYLSAIASEDWTLAGELHQWLVDEGVTLRRLTHSLLSWAGLVGSAGGAACTRRAGGVTSWELVQEAPITVLSALPGRGVLTYPVHAEEWVQRCPA